MAKLLKFLRCLHCNDVILLTDKPRQCSCGACTGARSGRDTDGKDLYAYTGRASTFQIDQDSLNQDQGAKFIGFVSGRRDIKLAENSTTASTSNVKRPVITVT